MIPKQPRMLFPTILAAAKGEACTMCGLNNGTVVFAHLNESWAGKGMSKKADDFAGMFLCQSCHWRYDNHLPTTPDQWEITRAMYRTWKRLIEKGIVKVC